MFDDDDLDPLDTNLWSMEEVNLWLTRDPKPKMPGVTMLTLEDYFITLSNLKKLLLSLPNLEDITLMELIDENGNEIPENKIFDAINLNKLPKLRRFDLNRTVYAKYNDKKRHSKYLNGSIQSFDRLKALTRKGWNLVDYIIGEKTGVKANIAENAYLGEKKMPGYSEDTKAKNYNRIIGKAINNINAKGVGRKSRKFRKSRKSKRTKKRKYKH